MLFQFISSTQPSPQFILLHFFAKRTCSLASIFHPIRQHSVIFCSYIYLVCTAKVPTLTTTQMILESMSLQLSSFGVLKLANAYLMLQSLHVHYLFQHCICLLQNSNVSKTAVFAEFSAHNEPNLQLGNKLHISSLRAAPIIFKIILISLLQDHSQINSFHFF